MMMKVLLTGLNLLLDLMGRLMNTTSFDDSSVTGVVALSVTPMQYEFVDVGLTVMLFDVADTDEYVASTFALSCEQVFPDGPVYHLTV